ncbi:MULTISPECIES: serine hydrolase domain-containing protein [Flagellimonas]|uniref:Beta-lactamase family protein n=1 Tax=Flagellimonas hadalis TaxID=2597517 RepID=A0A5N5IY40_9FLAO|nr:serine hydrolase domain-containing protein [Allomuricauda hadalis]KAB5490126.1 beta-lactamase family protein [Allomuricauda hadalis]
MKRKELMAKVFVIIIIIAALLACGEDEIPKPAENGLEAGNLLLGQTDTIFSKLKDFSNGTQVSFAFIHNGNVDHYGAIRLNDTLQTIENHDKAFELGSITKVFTTTLLANYIIDSSLSLDDRINGYFDFDFNEGLDFTFLELANHTSGLPSLPSNIHALAFLTPKNPYKNYDGEKLEEYLKDKVALEYEKGTKSSYSNLGMGLLSYTLTKYSQKPFGQLLEERIFSKYGMASSTTKKEEVGNVLVKGLDDKGRPTPNWDSGALIGAGGIYSTTEDLSKFALAQFDTLNRELVLTRRKTFTENDSRDVGLGWFIIHRKNGAKWYWHNGGTGGYSTSMVLDVNTKNGVIILSNISAFHKKSRNVDQLCFSLMDTLGKE